MTFSDVGVRLLKAKNTAVFIPFRNVHFKDETIPLQHKCHDNVRMWLRENRKDQVIIGWLVSGYILDRHSVLRARNGALFDITPLSHVLPFFPHPGTEPEFWSLPPQVNLVCW